MSKIFLPLQVKTELKLNSKIWRKVMLKLPLRLTII